MSTSLDRRSLLLPGGLIVLTLALYWPVHGYGFVAFDDEAYITNNPHLRDGFGPAGLRFAFTSCRMGNWNPLLWLSFFLDRSLLGLRPGLMHLENVLLHLIGGILIGRLLTLATGNFYRSWFVAALFLLHPMHVESVAWISERKDVLSTPLLIGAMICYVRFAKLKTPVLSYSQEPGNTVKQPGSWGYLPSSLSTMRSAESPSLRVEDRTGIRFFYSAMLLLFAFSLMAKSMGVSMPAVLLLMDFWPLARWPRTSWPRLIIEKIPLLMLSLAAAIMGSIAQSRIGTTLSLSELSMTDRINNAAVCYVMYGTKLIVPHQLAIYYPHPLYRTAGAVFASFALLGLITVVFARLRRRVPYLMVGWLWFLGTLLPVIGLVQIGGQAMADRYSYFPSIGFLILLVWGSADLLGWMMDADRHPRLQTSILAALVCGILAMSSALTARQVATWHDSETLFSHAINVGEDSNVARVMLAQSAYARRDIPTTVNQCLAALKLRPDARAYYTLGNCLVGADPGRASGYFLAAVNLAPKVVEFHVSLAMAYRLAGHPGNAMAEAQAALNLDPDDPDAREEMKNIRAAQHS